MEEIAKRVYDWAVQIADLSVWIVLAILVVVVLIVGISLMVSKKARDNAKEWIPWILVGTGVAMCPVLIAETIANSVKF